jgi:hypothetical protein
MFNFFSRSAKSILKYSWFQTFAVFWMFCAFFWVILRCLNFICRRFGTLCLFNLHRQVGVEWLGWRNIGVIIREKIGLKIARAKYFPVWMPQHFSNIVILHPPAYKDGTECSETSAYKIQPPENYPEESIKHLKLFCANNTSWTGIEIFGTKQYREQFL